jgi:lactate permease
LGFITAAGPGRIIPVFRHAGALLGYASLVGYLVYRQTGRYQAGALRRIVAGTVSRVAPASLAVLALVSMAVVMTHAGTTELLAGGLARAAGRAYPALAAWIGGLGAFITGSNTNSNVIFGQLQLRTAQLLGYRVPVLLAAQTAGGAIGSVLAPSKIVVGTSTAGLEGREGEVLRPLLGYCGVLMVGLSLIVALAA